MHALYIGVNMLFNIVISVHVLHAIAISMRNRDLVADILSRMTFRRFMLSLFLLGPVFLIAVAVIHCAPVTAQGILDLLAKYSPEQFSHEAGPVAIGKQEQEWWVMPALLMLAFAVCMLMPALAFTEERIVRKRRHGWPRLVGMSVLSGLAYSILNMPIAFAVGLVLPALLFAYKYRVEYAKQVEKTADLDWSSIIVPDDAAVLESASYRAMFNIVLLTAAVYLYFF